MTISNNYPNSAQKISIGLPSIGQTIFYVGAIAMTSVICYGLVKYAPSNPAKETAREIGVNLNEVKRLELTRTQFDSSFRKQQLDDLDATTNIMMVDTADF